VTTATMLGLETKDDLEKRFNTNENRRAHTFRNLSSSSLLERSGSFFMPALFAPVSPLVIAIRSDNRLINLSPCGLVDGLSVGFVVKFQVSVFFFI